MAGNLVICSTCKGALGITAAACPSCGTKTSTKGLTVLGWIGVTVILGSMVALLILPMAGCVGGVVGVLLVAIGRGEVPNRRAVRLATGEDLARLRLEPGATATSLPRLVSPIFLLTAAALLWCLWWTSREPERREAWHAAQQRREPGASAERDSTIAAASPGSAREPRPTEPAEEDDSTATAGWFCACVSEISDDETALTDDDVASTILVTVCRPSADECGAVERRARRARGALLGLDAACFNAGGDTHPDLTLEGGERWEPSARSGGWQLRGRCVRE